MRMDCRRAIRGELAAGPADWQQEGVERDDGNVSEEQQGHPAAR